MEGSLERLHKKINMKGIITAGGYGTRLHPLTKVTNKHLLPVYDKPLIYYPLKKLIDAGIREIMIVIGPEHSGHFLNLLGSGRELGCRFTFEVQEKAGGIAEAVLMARDFAEGDNVMVILGDNIFEDDFGDDVREFENGRGGAFGGANGGANCGANRGAKIFLKEVTDANRFGVATIDGERVLKVVEKPANPETNLAVTGCYLYDNRVFEIIKNLKPSARGELEITDVQNAYISMGEMRYRVLKGAWSDAGTFESLYRASTYARETAMNREHGSLRDHQTDMRKFPTSYL